VSEPREIQRWMYSCFYEDHRKDDDGKWVLHADHIAKVAELEQKCRRYSDQQTEDHDLIEMLRAQLAEAQATITNLQKQLDAANLGWA